jgi:hypothetical protein
MPVVHEQVGRQVQAAQDVGAARAVRAVGEDVGLGAGRGDAGLDGAVHRYGGGEEFVWELQADLRRSISTLLSLSLSL